MENDVERYEDLNEGTAPTQLVAFEGEWGLKQVSKSGQRQAMPDNPFEDSALTVTYDVLGRVIEPED